MNKLNLSSQIASDQLVGVFGVGSIYELRSHWAAGPSVLHSVMVAGLDFWDRDHLHEVHDPVLASILNVKNFFAPPALNQHSDRQHDFQASVPVVRFPRWLVCSQCQRLGKVPSEFIDIGFTGPSCRAPGCKGRGIPVRLVVACFGEDGEQPGHIDDFPWSWWAHSGKVCSEPQLKLEAKPGSTSLSGLLVSCYNPVCREHQISRTLGDALMPEMLATQHCTGHRPWLNDHEKGCQRKVRAVFRHASNVYFPVTASAISIPPYSAEVTQILLRHFGTLIGITRRQLNRGKDVDWEDIIDSLCEESPTLRRYPAKQLRAAVLALAQPPDEDIGEQEHRSRERLAILAGQSEDADPGSVFVAIRESKSAFSPWLSSIVTALVRVERLRVVRALSGFQRIRATGLAPLRTKNDDRGWLPAIEAFGEGIYLELNPATVKKWSGKPLVMERIELLMRNFSAAGGQIPNNQNKIVPGLVLLHTLSHLLVKQLSLDSGYSTGSLHERLY
ncbi:MAG: DrmB family protein [Firmicutes bacterium]|nr:DrmB family protein [Bacillota bacterium]